MINALHLLWLLPLSAVVGYAVCVLMMIRKDIETFEELDDV